MANDTIGTVTCPHCQGKADVRQDKKKKLYYLCGGRDWAKGCGKFAPSTGPGQEWLRKNMRALDAPPVPAAPAPAPAPQEAPPPEVKKDFQDKKTETPPPAKKPWWAEEVQG